MGLNGITLNQLELVLITKLIHTLRDLGSHARVNFHSYSLFASLQQRGSEVSSTGTNFKNHIGRFDSRLLNDLLDDKGILEDMLAKSLIKSEIIAGTWGLSHSLTLLLHYLIEYY